MEWNSIYAEWAEGQGIHSSSTDEKLFVLHTDCLSDRNLSDVK